MNDQEGLAIALEQAKIGYREGGVPVSITGYNHLLHHLTLATGGSRFGLKGWEASGTGS
jgi:hypothetical protein